ncbi:uncharacterized protein E5676_scaffold398G00210 [Cucumis melo var. makuwa]|uniref:Uncharacterized protein n=1 Tax=Cucumis melo var. makuwa TaxID=1194695 RepID=A0A5D3E739_CUCMM|nr:uncharacterized protein E5676_scaffold398G00210 [Cucumis melo var. makuwa]
MTQTESGQDAGSSTSRVYTEVEIDQFAKSAQEIGRLERVGHSDPKKMYGIELKKLGPQCLRVQQIQLMLRQALPTTYCEAKRDEFLGLKQGSLLVAVYERKYTELSWYADVTVTSESDRCQWFERGLHLKIRTLGNEVSVDLQKVEAIVYWERLASATEVRSFRSLAGY